MIRIGIAGSVSQETLWMELLVLDFLAVDEVITRQVWKIWHSVSQKLILIKLVNFIVKTSRDL